MSINFRRHADKLLNADIVSTEMHYAIFSDELSTDTKNEIVSVLNHGGKMLEIYSQYRENMHIVNVVEMINKIENEFRQYSKERFESKRKSI